MATTEVLLDGLAFPEGPRWHDGRLVFSDMHAHQVLSLDPVSGGTEVLFEHTGPVSGLGWDGDGRMLVVSMHDRVLLRDGEPFADLSPFEREQSNDMVVDAVGRAYVGGFGFLWDQEPVGTHLVLVDTDGSARPVADDLLFPNGAVITDDGGTLVVGETMASRLTAFDIDAETGSLSNRRTWAQLERVSPDGCCLDAEGAVWVADPPHREVLRVREGGEVVDRVSTAPHMAIACMLGGHDRRTLFVLTAGGLDAERARSERWGRIEAVEVEVPGAGLP
jgi:sugar lactone lactonase YvrE